MAEQQNKPLVLIMAGGSGTRFWPLSTPDYPKQFLKLVDSLSLLQATYERVLQLVPEENIAVCGLERHAALLREQLPKVKHWILEPVGRNTAACNLLSILQLLKEGASRDQVLIVLPADHHVGQPQKLCETLEKAASFAAESNALVTLGIQPSSPHTGYGYIERGRPTGTDGIFEVARFIEKPSETKAQELLKQGNYYWNSGMFIWTIGNILSAFEEFLPETTQLLKNCSTTEALKKAYTKLPSEPIDKAILEKAKNVFTLPADVAWSDLGSWDALYQLYKSSSEKNVILGGQTEVVDSDGCLVHAPPEMQVALIGVHNLAVVIQDGKLLITDRAQDQHVKKVLEKFEK